MQHFTDQSSTPYQRVVPDPDKDVAKCKCGCTFFEEVRVQQIAQYHSVILGQAVRGIGADFVLYRCFKCEEITEPNLLRNRRDYTTKLYDVFLDQMKDKPKEEVTEKTDEVQDS